ncbi:hypothetical protein L2E82_33090 [Cichorium intybus]|uniref:Uncharacterized protein n=1 Tax=Cichorium intybus TaxID=13427 RepID=A0ACB9BJ86_CICIN|nr:hypothetical protein L2E82_33090 [Cichorium intybus]
MCDPEDSFVGGDKSTEDLVNREHHQLGQRWRLRRRHGEYKVSEDEVEENEADVVGFYIGIEEGKDIKIKCQKPKKPLEGFIFYFNLISPPHRSTSSWQMRHWSRSAKPAARFPYAATDDATWADVPVPPGRNVLDASMGGGGMVSVPYDIGGIP